MSGVVGISMFRDEEDVAPYVIAHMLEEVDRLIVADHLSADRTRAILEALDEPRLTIIDERRPGYEQPAIMARLIDMADAGWIVPFDFDEWWYCPDGRRIADALAVLPGAVYIAPSFEMLPQRDDPDDPDPFQRITTHRLISNTQKVVFRPAPGRALSMGNHMVSDHPGEPGPITVLHYPYRTLEQARRKVRVGKAALEATAYGQDWGRHWRELGALSDRAFAEWFVAWCRP